MARRKAVKTQLIPDSVTKPSGIKHDGTPNAHWRKFEQRLKAFADIPLSEWKEEEILGYLLKRYTEHYQIDWALSYSGPPSRCAEMYIVRRTMTAVGTQKASIMKQYIDWVFDKDIIPKRKQISSLAYFFAPGLCNQFRAEFRKNSTITRTTELPQDYATIVNGLQLSLNTYGDLAFARMAIQGQSDDTMAPYVLLFNQLRDLGFNESILETLE